MLKGFDFDSQLAAVKVLLKDLRKVDEAHTQRVKELSALADAETGDEHGFPCADAYVDLCHEGIYMAATHSMAAVSMLAPLTEGLFVGLFRGLGIRAEKKGMPVGMDARRRATPEQLWDPHFVFKPGSKGEKSIVRGIEQVAVCSGLVEHLPKDYLIKLDALFAYRNKMLHCGFEWPEDERAAFAKRLPDWPVDWFQLASINDKPWTFYMSWSFIDCCIAFVDDIQLGAGAFIRNADGTLGEILRRH